MYILSFVIILVILCIYLSTAIGGYYVHGDNSKANILLTLPRGGLRISIEVLLTVHLFAAFAININPIVQIFEKKLQIAHGKQLFCLLFSLITQYIQVLIVF